MGLRYFLISLAAPDHILSQPNICQSVRDVNSCFPPDSGRLSRKGGESIPQCRSQIPFPMMEKTLRQSLFKARGEVGAILVRPISLVQYSIAAAVIISPFSTGRRKINRKPAANNSPSSLSIQRGESAPGIRAKALNYGHLYRLRDHH